MAHPDLAVLSVSATHYPARDFSLVDVNAAGASKSGALAAVAAHLGVAREAVFAIGDNHNDIDMLQWAGTGVVMGNAEPEVLALGLPIAPTNDEAGLAAALRRYVSRGSGARGWRVPSVGFASPRIHGGDARALKSSGQFVVA